MCTPRQKLPVRLSRLTLSTALVILCNVAVAQPPVWNAPMVNGYAAYPAATYPAASYPPVNYGPMSAPGYGGYFAVPPAGNPAFDAANRPAAPAARGRLARLVRNTSTSDGSPPFALADQNGTVQRFVEPVPGIDLEPYIGQVVTVRHDSGRTLLATQLDLPPRPLLPMVGDMTGLNSAARNPVALRPLATDSNEAQPRGVRPVRFVDNDDATVQLISDDQDAKGDPVGQERSAVVKSSPIISSETMLPGGASPADLPLGSMSDARYDGSMIAGPMFPDAMSGEFIQGDVPFGDACPQCGRRHGIVGCNPGWGDEAGPRAKPRPANQAPWGHCYGDVQLNFLRIHLMEGSVGKLSERYELSPRFTLGFDGDGALGARVRYWIYDRETPLLAGGEISVELKVLDLEATHRFQVGQSDLIVAAGIRWAGLEIDDVDGDNTGIDLIGMTVAADVRTPLCMYRGGQIAWVYGGRLAILGGDWNGSSNNDLVSGELQDDNVIVESIFAGLQYAMRYKDCNVIARLAFEIQNWHSDVLSQNAGADSLGFLGPGVHIGASF